MNTKTFYFLLLFKTSQFWRRSVTNYITDECFFKVVLLYLLIALEITRNK